LVAKTADWKLATDTRRHCCWSMVRSRRVLCRRHLCALGADDELVRHPPPLRRR